MSARGRFCFADVQKVEGSPIRDSIVVSISACHADDPGSIPGRGVFSYAKKQMQSNKHKKFNAPYWD